MLYFSKCLCMDSFCHLLPFSLVLNIYLFSCIRPQLQHMRASLHHAGSFIVAHGLSSSGTNSQPHDMWDLQFPNQGLNPHACIIRRIPNQWTTREVPSLSPLQLSLKIARVALKLRTALQVSTLVTAVICSLMMKKQRDQEAKKIFLFSQERERDRKWATP